VGVHVIIDGNNLFHAIRDLAAATSIGREKLVRLIERWAQRGRRAATLVFDGPPPPGGLARQMSSPRIDVRFSGSRTADDVIVDLVNAAANPHEIRVVSNDSAIGHAARYRRCQHTLCDDFIRELYQDGDEQSGRTDSVSKKPGSSPPFGGHEKPVAPSSDEAKRWLDTFGYDPDDKEPFDGSEAMED